MNVAILAKFVPMTVKFVPVLRSIWWETSGSFIPKIQTTRITKHPGLAPLPGILSTPFKTFLYNWVANEPMDGDACGLRFLKKMVDS